MPPSYLAEEWARVATGCPARVRMSIGVSYILHMHERRRVFGQYRVYTQGISRAGLDGGHRGGTRQCLGMPQIDASRKPQL